MQLHDKVAFITGAGSGIGKAAALLFAQEGAKVVCDEPHAWKKIQANRGSRSPKPAVRRIAVDVRYFQIRFDIQKRR